MDNDTEAAWLDEAVRAATQNAAEGGGPFAALIVQGTEIIATGVNRVTADLDPTAHAEVTAIRAACAARGTFDLNGCVLVSSCEPCPMCLFAALWARVDRVIYAGDRDDAAGAGFHDRAFYDLVDTPRDAWDMPVVHVPTADGQAPFAAWLRNPDRVEY